MSERRATRRLTIEGALCGLVLAGLAGGAVAGCGSSSASTHRRAPAPVRASTGARASTRPAVARTPTTSTHPAPPPPDPGRLPQTDQQPSAQTAAFQQEMQALWQAVQTGSVSAGMPAFFPESAYLQVKAIADPSADWQNRLVGGYAADIAAAHALLGAGAASARLVSVIVPPGYAHWVQPGTCYNSIGYWETPNSRMVYSEDGQERSFGIASMISWRGVWYVVHLGAVLPSGTGGTVDAPSAGQGYAAPSSTC